MPPYSTIAGTGHLEQVPHTTKRGPFALRRQRPSHHVAGANSSGGSSSALTLSSSFSYSSSSSSDHHHHHPEQQYNTLQETQEYRQVQYIRDATQTLESTLQMLGHLLQTCGGVSSQAVSEMLLLPTHLLVLKRAQTYLLCCLSSSQQQQQQEERQALLIFLVQAWESLVRLLQLEQRLVYRKLNQYKMNGGVSIVEIRKTSDELTVRSEACTQALVGLWKVQRLVKRRTATTKQQQQQQQSHQEEHDKSTNTI